MRGRFITLEGVEGVGKSTNLHFVAELVRARGHEVLVTREPGGTPLAEMVRDVVLQRAEETVPPDAELLLMFAARAIHLENRIIPALDNGAWVVCDRFTDATYAYQGGGRGADKAWIEELENRVQGDLRPDLTLLLDVDAEIGLQRANDRSEADRFESERIEFFDRVRRAYLERAEAEPQRIRVVDAGMSLDDVQVQIRSIINNIL